MLTRSVVWYAVNASRGAASLRFAGDESPILGIPVTSGRERLYGIHSVLAALEVAARHQGRHPRRLGEPMQLYVRDFSHGLHQRSSCVLQSTEMSESAAAATSLENHEQQQHTAHEENSDSDTLNGINKSKPCVALPAAKEAPLTLPPADVYPKLHKVVSLARRLGVSITPVERNKLTWLCGERRNQNVVLETPTYRQKDVGLYLPPTCLKHGGEVVVVLDGVRDPMNVGHILRTVSFFGVRTVVLSADTASCTSTVSKTSTGALEWLNVIRLRDSVCSSAFLKRTQEEFSKTVSEAKNNTSSPPRLLVFGTTATPPTARSSDTSRTSRCSQPSTILLSALSKVLSAPSSAPSSSSSSVSPAAVLVLGNEDVGLSQEMQKACTHLLHIPSRGDRSYATTGLSLNVNSACAVLMSCITQAIDG